MPAENIVMSENKVKASGKAYVPKQDPYPFDKMSQPILRCYLYAVIVLFPMLVDHTKYSQITKFKLTTFITFFAVAAIAFASAALLSAATRVTPRRRLTEDELLAPTAFADLAIIVYWLFMIISTIGAFDKATAFSGMTPRNNGFLIQTMYTATYFMLSRGLKPKISDALVFVWGGALFGTACIVHFFGWDIYDIGSVNGADYAGPFWTTTKYRFLGPMGNVNLGSYVLAIAAVIAAGAYIQKIAVKWDKYNAITLSCFAVILFAELNINTDAGLVALAAAIIFIPVMLCGGFDKMVRMIHVFTVSAAVLLLDNLIVEVWLREEKFGTLAKLLTLAVPALILLSVLLTLFSDKLKNTAFGKASPAAYRRVCAALMAVVIAAGIGLTLYITKPDPTPAGSIAGAIEVVETYEYKEKTDTILHELGQILRGNFDDDFGHNRLFTWKRSLRLVELRPFFGIGPDNFRQIFAYFFSEEAKDQFPSSGGGVDKAHNEFLDVLVDNGIFGFAAYMTFFGFLLYYAFRRSDEKKLSPVFGVAIISYMAHAFFGYQLPIQSPCMWVMIGIGAAFIRTEEQALANKTEES